METWPGAVDGMASCEIPWLTVLHASIGLRIVACSGAYIGLLPTGLNHVHILEITYQSFLTTQNVTALVWLRLE